MDVPLGEVCHFDCITSHPSTGAVTDADSTPTFAVYEESTDTDIGVGGNLTKRTSLDGNYRGSFTASGANGFEAGKWYSVVASATVNSIAGKGVVMHFRAVVAENVAGVPGGDATHVAGTAQTAGDIIASIAGIGTAGGAAVNVDANTDNASGGITGVTSGTTKVGTETGTFANTSNINGVYHQITHSADAIDWVYQFLTGGGTSVVSSRWTGYVSGTNDTITFYAWDHVGGAWESLGTQAGQAGSSNVTKDLTLYARHRGTSAAELGKIYIRLACTGMSAPVLYTDQLFVSYSVTSRSVGYANGAVWVDTVNGTAGTESFVNGVADNPVLSLADAMTIATALALRKFEVGNGSSITLSASTANNVFNGHEWVLALGGQSISSSTFIDATVSGTGSGSAAEFETCEIQTASISDSNFHRCAFNATLTLNAAGDYMFADCYSHVAGTSAPVFDFTGAGTKTASFRRWSGGMTINNISSSHTISIDCVSGGTITLNGADGNVQIRGMCAAIVDNRTGTPTLGTNAVINQTYLATPTNITAGTITTATNVTTVNGLTANVITAAALATDAVTEIQSGLSTQTSVDTLTAYVDTEVAAIKTVTDAIGATGSGLSAIPWNASWDTEVQSEVNDGLVALGLDHLVAASVTGTDIVDNSIVAYLASKSATADWDSFVNTSDSLQAIADAGGSGLTEQNIEDIVDAVVADLSGANITIQSSVTPGGTVTIIQGQTYASGARLLQIQSDAFPTLTAATAVIRYRDGTGTVVNVASTAVDNDEKWIQFDVTATVSAAFAKGKFAASLIITLASTAVHIVPLTRVIVTNEYGEA